MIVQMDADRNMTLVMTQRETVSLHRLSSAAVDAIEVGLREASQFDLSVLKMVSGAMFRLTDDEIVTAWLEVADTNDPDHLREAVRKRLVPARAKAVAAGHASE